MYTYLRTAWYVNEINSLTRHSQPSRWQRELNRDPLVLSDEPIAARPGCDEGSPRSDESREHDPHCPACGGILKTDTISSLQPLVPEVIDRAMTVAAESELLLAIGTTVQVHPVANMVPIESRAGADFVIVDEGPKAMDALAEEVIRAPMGDVPARICAARTPEAN